MVTALWRWGIGKEGKEQIVGAALPSARRWSMEVAAGSEFDAEGQQDRLELDAPRAQGDMLRDGWRQRAEPCASPIPIEVSGARGPSSTRSPPVAL